jgi:hypothetical protein
MPQARVIGRILSLGYPMPGIQVDNYNIISAPSFFDYDALIVDPRSTAALIEGVLDGSTDVRTFGGATVRPVPGHWDEVALADVLCRRRDETRALLERGGLAVVFAYPATMHAVPRTSDLDDYWWLDDAVHEELRPPAMLAGEGSQAHVVDWQHPMAAFVSSQLANIAYRARFDRRDLPVFARSHGGAAIGVEIPLQRGRIYFVPALKAAPAGEGRYAASDALQAGIRRALDAQAQGRAPTWVTSLDLPGLAERAARVGEARSAATDANNSLAEAEAEYEAVARWQRLLWQEGSTGLDAIVVEALRFITCEVYDRDGSELELRCPEGTALVEIEGSEQPIAVAAHHRLRQRIERAIERRGAAPRGVLFVNGQRLQPPAQRQHVTDAVRISAEMMRYCIASTPGLYDAVVAKLKGDDAAVEQYRQRLVATDGLLA